MHTEVDLSSLTVSRDGETIQLTRVECEIFAALARANGRVLSFDFLFQSIEAVTRKEAGLSSLCVHLSHLRAKLKPFGIRIENLRGVGYRLKKMDFVFPEPIRWNGEARA